MIAVQEFDKEVVQVVRTVARTVFSKTFLLAAADVKGLLQLDTFEEFEQYYQFKAARVVTKSYL